MIARVHAILRRTGYEGEDDGILRFADSRDRRDATRCAGGQSDPAHGDRVQPLALLPLNPCHVLSKSQILDHVWHYDFGGDGNVVETYASYLRKKLERHGPPLIHTIRLVGLHPPRAGAHRRIELSVTPTPTPPGRRGDRHRGAGGR